MKINKNGFTLVEVIVTLTLLSIIITLGYSIYIFGLKNYTTQSNNVNNQSNVRYALSSIIKEIRKADDVVISSNKITLNGSIEYKLDGTTIMKNSDEVVNGIQTLDVQQIDRKIIIRITSLPNVDGNVVDLSSEIYIRE